MADKYSILRKIAVELPKILTANQFNTDLGQSVQYGIDTPEFRNRDGIQWIDGEDEETQRPRNMLSLIISVVLFGNRAALLEKSILAEQDIRLALMACSLASYKLSLEKSLEESGDNSTLHLMFTAKIPWMEPTRQR